VTRARRFLRSTRGRLTLISVAVLGIALAIADGAIYESFAFDETKDTDAVLTTQVGLIVPLVRDQPNRVRFEAQSENGVPIDFALIGKSGLITQSPSQPLSATTILSIASDATRKGEVWSSITDPTGIARRIYARRLVTDEQGTVVLVAIRSIAELRVALARLSLLLLLLTLPVLAIVGLLAYWLTGRILSPVRNIAGIAQTLSENDLHRRVVVRVPDDELGELVQTFNGMLTRLEAGFESLRRFTGDASHELRAPITVIRTDVEVALSRPRSAEAYMSTLQRVQAEAEHLARVVDQLLILARADAAALRPATEAVDVADFIHETANRWEAVARRNQLDLVVTAPRSGSVQADPSLLRRVLDNLIDNAIRHSPAGGKVLVGAERRDGTWILQVSDQGSGIPAAHRAHLFSRFAKADGARTRNGSGAGLGLALCSAIVKAHGGSIRLVSEPNVGALFELTIPDGPRGQSEARLTHEPPA
jgi:heavy metal sensor kinase